MIECETDVFNAVATALRTAYEDIYVVGEYVSAPKKFPAVYIIENDNRVLERYRTETIENAVSVMYEVNIFSNKASGKKAEAKAIAATVDAAFVSHGFTRTMRNQVPNLNDATIYRIVCRYEAIVDKDLQVYYND